MCLCALLEELDGDLLDPSDFTAWRVTFPAVSQGRGRVREEMLLPWSDRLVVDYGIRSANRMALSSLPLTDNLFLGIEWRHKLSAGAATAAVAG